MNNTQTIIPIEGKTRNVERVVGLKTRTLLTLVVKFDEE